MHSVNFDIAPEGPYFGILRAAIWNTEVETTSWPEVVEWEAVIENFEKQAMLPLVGGVLCSLTGKYRISEEQEEKILQISSNTVQTNYRNREVTAILLEALREAGCKPVLLKGDTLARLYPNPNLRACGDIDILVHPDHYQVAIRTLQEICKDQGHEDFLERHYQLQYEEFIVELHRHPGFCANLWYEKRYQELASQWVVGTGTETHIENGVSVPVPATQLLPQFNCWYVFNHLLHHYHDGGIGLRQFVDWMLVLKDAAVNKSVDVARLQADLEAVGLLRAWRILGHLLVDYLGLPKEEFPLYVDDCDDRLILERYLPEFVAYGNFGRRFEKHKKSSNWVVKKWSTLVETVKMGRKLWSLMPSGAIGYCWGNCLMAFRRKSKV